MASDLDQFFLSQSAGSDKPGADSLDEFYKSGAPVKVQRTLDADTLEETKPGKLLVDGVRFEGIDAPEMSQGSLGKEAQDYLDSELAKSKSVHIVPRGRDFHGRVLGSVYADGRNMNLELVRQGHAKAAYLDGLTPAMKQKMQDAEDEAREASRGIWAPDSGYVDSADFRAAERASKGKGAGALGHDGRDRLDPDSKTVRQVAFDVQNEGKDQDQQLEEFFRGAAGGSVASDVAGHGGSGGSGDEPSGRGFLDRVLEGLDYAGNASRSFLLGASESAAHGGGFIDQARQGLDFGGQALDKKRHTSSSELKDSITKRYGLGRVRAGKDDGDFQLGDLADFGGDLLLDVVTDPLTYVTAGVGEFAKGASSGAKALSEAKLGLDTAGAVKAAKIHAAGRAALGAVYGVGSTDENADVLDYVGAASVGAGLGLAAGPALEKIGAATRARFDKLSNWYAETTRGSKFSDFANQRAVALEAYDKTKNIAEWIRQGRLDALKDLVPEQRIKATELMQSLKTETIRQRKAMVEKFGIQEGTPEWNQMAQAVNQKVADEYLPELMAKEGEKVGSAVLAWKDHNEAVVKKLNQSLHGLEDGVAKDGLGLVGIGFHVDDVAKLADFEEASNAFKNTRIYQAKGLERSEGVLEQMRKKYAPLLDSGQMSEAQFKALVHDTNYSIYAEKFSKSFLDDMEQKASHLMREYGETRAFGLAPSEFGPERALSVGQKAVRAGESALKGLDKLTNFTKANMLYFSLSWIKNNYFDNVAKAFVENGMAGLVDTAASGALRKGLSNDVWKLYKGDVSHLYKAADFKDMLNLGVLDNPMYKSMTDEMTRDFMFRPSEIAKAGEKSIANYMNKATDVWFSKNPVISLVSRTGSYMEGTARAVTYARTLEALNATAALDGVKPFVKKQMASRVVKQTFFDYSDVSHFEGAVLKRLVPFYSFYAKNLPYWMKAVFDPEKVGRVIALEKVRHNIGHDPSSADYASMTPYVADAAPRKLGRDEHGNQQYLISPSTSMHDAVRTINPKDWLDQFVEKATPIPKAVVELVAGKDAFSGDDLYPDKTKGNDKKFLYSRGFKWVVVKRTLEALGAKPDSVFQKVAGTSGVDVDRNGNPYTSSGWTIVLDRIASTLLPHGFVDQVAGSVGKLGVGKETLDEVIFNRLAPMQNVKVSPSFARMVRVRKLADRAKDKNP